MGAGRPEPPQLANGLLQFVVRDVGVNVREVERADDVALGEAARDGGGDDRLGLASRPDLDDGLGDGPEFAGGEETRLDGPVVGVPQEPDERLGLRDLGVGRQGDGVPARPRGALLA